MALSRHLEPRRRQWRGESGHFQPYGRHLVEIRDTPCRNFSVGLSQIELTIHRSEKLDHARSLAEAWKQILQRYRGRAVEVTQVIGLRLQNAPVRRREYSRQQKRKPWPSFMVHFFTELMIGRVRIAETVPEATA